MPEQISVPQNKHYAIFIVECYILIYKIVSKMLKSALKMYYKETNAYVSHSDSITMWRKALFWAIYGRNCSDYTFLRYKKYLKYYLWGSYGFLIT